MAPVPVTLANHYRPSMCILASAASPRELDLIPRLLNATY